MEMQDLKRNQFAQMYGMQGAPQTQAGWQQWNIPANMMDTVVVRYPPLAQAPVRDYFAPVVPTRRPPTVFGTQGNCGMYEVTPVHDSTTEEFLKAIEPYSGAFNFMFSDNDQGNGFKIAEELKAHGHVVESLIFPGKHGHKVRAWFFTKFRPGEDQLSAEEEDDDGDEDEVEFDQEYADAIY
jgi:hypothetical protein